MLGNTGGRRTWQAGGLVRTRHERYESEPHGPFETFEAQTALRDLENCADEDVEEVVARYLVARTLRRWANGAADEAEIEREREDTEACIALLPQSDAAVLRTAVRSIGGPELTAAQAAFAAAAAASDRHRLGGAWALALAALDLAISAGEAWLATAIARQIAAIAAAADFGDDVVDFWNRTAARLEASSN